MSRWLVRWAKLLRMHRTVITWKTLRKQFLAVFTLYLRSLVSLFLRGNAVAAQTQLVSIPYRINSLHLLLLDLSNWFLELVFSTFRRAFLGDTLLRVSEGLKIYVFLNCWSWWSLFLEGVFEASSLRVEWVVTGDLSGVVSCFYCTHYFLLSSILYLSL